MKTRAIKEKEVEQQWFLIDAAGVRLGKIAVAAANLLMGKNSILRTSYLEPKNKVVIVNSEKLDYYPTKASSKVYSRHSGYPGGYKEITLGKLMGKSPEKVIELAVKRMLPKTKQGDKMFSNLNVFKGQEHSFSAQKPLEVKVK